MSRQTVALDLVGMSEIAERAGVKRGTVETWRRRHAETFPRPLAVLAIGPVWSWADVAPWLAIPRPSGGRRY